MPTGQPLFDTYNDGRIHHVFKIDPSDNVTLGRSDQVVIHEGPAGSDFMHVKGDLRVDGQLFATVPEDRRQLPSNVPAGSVPYWDVEANAWMVSDSLYLSVDKHVTLRGWVIDKVNAIARVTATTFRNAVPAVVGMSYLGNQLFGGIALKQSDDGYTTLQGTGVDISTNDQVALSIDNNIHLKLDLYDKDGLQISGSSNHEARMNSIEQTLLTLQNNSYGIENLEQRIEHVKSIVDSLTGQ